MGRKVVDERVLSKHADVVAVLHRRRLRSVPREKRLSAQLHRQLPMIDPLQSDCLEPQQRIHQIELVVVQVQDDFQPLQLRLHDHLQLVLPSIQSDKQSDSTAYFGRSHCVAALSCCFSSPRYGTLPPR